MQKAEIQLIRGNSSHELVAANLVQLSSDRVADHIIFVGMCSSSTGNVSSTLVKIHGLETGFIFEFVRSSVRPSVRPSVRSFVRSIVLGAKKAEKSEKKKELSRQSDIAH